VGRSSELALLRARLADAASGAPQVVLVEGPSGVGKSTLLQAFVDGLEHATVHFASGDESETHLRFGVLQQLLGLRQAGWADPFAAGAALLRSLDERPGEEPTVFVVDDAHDADAESLAALTFALRRLRADRVMAVVVARDDDSGNLPPGLLKLADSAQSRVLLGGLTEDDVLSLASALGLRASHGSAARLQQHTSGNPLYLRALLRELGSDALEAPGPLPAPHSYSQLVLRSVASQSEEAQQFARAASVLADDSRLSVVAAVAGIDEPEAALDDMVKAHVLRCEYAEDGWRIGFVHPLVRAAVYDDLGPLDRKRLHASAAAMLDGDEALLHRLAAASGPDQVLASAFADRARQLQDAGDVRGAADYYLKAGRLAEEEGLSWLTDAATLFLIAGDVASAKEAEEAIPDDVDGALRDYLKVRIAWFGGDPGTAVELATEAWWNRADEPRGTGRGELAAVLAQLHNLQGDGSGAAEWAERALAEELPPDLVDSTTAARAVGLVIAGQPAAALDTLSDLPSNPDDVGPNEQHQLTARGALRALQDDLDDARVDLDALLRSSASILAPERLLGMGVLAEVDYRLGRWDSSVTLAEQAVSLAEDGEQLWIQGYLHAMAVLVSAGRGWWSRAEEHLARGRRLAEQLSDPVTWAVCENVGIHVASCRGEPEEVVARSQLLLSLVGGPTDEPGWFNWPVQYASALVQLGRDDEAEAELARLNVIAVERGSRSRLAALARVQGELATARREHSRARASFGEALRLSDAASALEQGMIRASYGRFLRRRGERRAARAELEAASERFRALGATPLLEAYADELAACGVGSDATTPSVTEGLTPQEQIVVRLACEGHTNHEVAAQLVLSVKTVGYHLSNAYVKLGVHSRAQLVAKLGAVSAP